MAVYTNAGGGGGISSDELTAARGDVLKGKTAVTSDSSDEPVEGTLELTGDAADSHVLSGKTYYNKDPKTRRAGTMPNRGAVAQELAAGGSYTVPEGYHNGAGKVTAKSLASQTGGATAADGDVLSGKTYWKDGAKRTGTMANQGAKTAALNAGGSYAIPAGYHNGSGRVTANSLASQTSANAAAGHILSGKTAWVNGSKLTGNIASMGGQTITPTASQQTVNCSGKYMTGNIVVKGVGIYETMYLMGLCTRAIEYGTFASISGIVGSIDKIYFFYGINYGTTDSQWNSDANNTFVIPHKFGRFAGSPVLDGQYHWYYTGTQNGNVADGSDIRTEFKMAFSGGTFSIIWRADRRMSICGHLLIITKN